jgi:hypothetical protein
MIDDGGQIDPDARPFSDTAAHLHLPIVSSRREAGTSARPYEPES